VDERTAPFSVAYVELDRARLEWRDPDLILGVVGYGTGRPDFLAARVAFIEAPLRALSGPMLEIWSGTSPARPVHVGSVTGACGDDLAFGAISLRDEGNAALEIIVERAYLEIFDFMEATGFSEPVRVWNYLTGILAEEDGLQRYMRFNIGRHLAYTARLRQPVPPAASGVGGYEGGSVIYFLAARTPARAIENPRQVSAFHYPPVYGPRSPSFSRASVYPLGQAEAMFISGTASIVGHETRHADDLHAQIAETSRNLQALIDAASATRMKAGAWSSKIYLRNPEDRDAVSHAVDEIFGLQSQRLFLHGDICRTGLRLEIEAFFQPGLPSWLDETGSASIGLRPA